MRTFKNLLWAILPIFALTFAVGCEDPQQGVDQPNVVKDSTIKLGKTTVNVGVAGGTTLIEYTIENAHAGEKISAEASESWVNNFNYGITGALGFNVDANTGTEERQCLVTVKYRYADDVVFVVKQGAKTGAGFALENITSDFFSYTVDVIPSNKTMPYIVMSASPDYIVSSGFESDEDYYQDDVAYFEWIGSYYGYSAADIMNIRAKIGDQRGITVNEAVSGVPYKFYCYYFDSSTGALASDIAFFTITTKKPEKNGATFTAEHTVDGCVVSAKVTPVGGYEGAYYFDMLNGLMVDYYLEVYSDFLKTPADVAEFFWATGVSEMKFQGNLSSDAIITMYDCQGEYEDGTPRSEYDFELLANHTYYLFAFAMDENALCCSAPFIEKIETGSVPMSDNVITASVSNVTAQTAYISFTTTNDDYYIAGWEKAADWATYGSTDAERQKYLLENLSYEYLSGDYSQNVIGLESGVEYVLYAFGSRGGVATTSTISTCVFTTKSGVGSATVEFVDHGYFAAADLAEAPGWEFLAGDYYSGKFILPLEFKITGDYQSFFMVIFDWTGRYDEYNDTQYRDNLVWSINEYGSMSPDKSYTVLENESAYTLAALVVDPDGYYSDVVKMKVNTSYDGARTDVMDFAEQWSSNDGPSLQARTLFAKKHVRNAKYSEAETVAVERKAVAHDVEILKR